MKKSTPHNEIPKLIPRDRSAAEISDDPQRIRTIEEASAVMLKAMDGYANMAAFIGENSPLMASGTFVRNDLTRNQELLTTTYRVSWLAKKIIDMPAEDMTRCWYRLSTSMPEKDLHKLHVLEARHSVKQEITNAIRWARLYGGSIALICLRGEYDRLDQPLHLYGIRERSFEGLLVLDRTEVTPSMELVTNLNDPDYGLPKYYTVELDADEDDMEGPRVMKIHHSRVLRFIGRDLPNRESIREERWGASELEHIWEELMKRSTASANIAQLLFQANITTLKMGHLGSNLVMGTERNKENIMQMIENQNRLRTSYGLQIMSADDSMENHPYTFAGLSDIYEAFMLDMAGASEIPATKLFGRSPQGMNATGEEDLRNYYDMIGQLQERHLRPALEKLFRVMAMSCWGYIPPDYEIVFEPMMTINPSERAELIQKLNADIIEAFKCGLVTKEQALEEMKSRGMTLGSWTKLSDQRRGNEFAAG